MKVAEEKQTMYCYSCKISYNAISYLENYEHLSFKETINLLAQIFLFPLPYYNPNLEELAKKYQESLLNQEYETLIQNDYQRIIDKSDDTLGDPLEHANTFLTFRQELISRIKNQEFDKDFVYKEPSKRFFLK